MNFIKIASRIILSFVIITVFFEAIFKNGQSHTSIYNAYETLQGCLTMIGLLIIGGFYGEIEDY